MPCSGHPQRRLGCTEEPNFHLSPSYEASYPTIPMPRLPDRAELGHWGAGGGDGRHGGGQPLPEFGEVGFKDGGECAHATVRQLAAIAETSQTMQLPNNRSYTWGVWLEGSWEGAGV